MTQNSLSRDFMAVRSNRIQTEGSRPELNMRTIFFYPLSLPLLGYLAASWANLHMLLVSKSRSWHLNLYKLMVQIPQMLPGLSSG